MVADCFKRNVTLPMVTSQDDVRKLATRTNWILDIDDCVYTIDGGLHDRIKKRIVEQANEDPDILCLLPDILGEDRALKATDLGAAFPKIVAEVKSRGPDALQAYYKSVYEFSAVSGHDGWILPNPALVNALMSAHYDLGKRILINTNGPWDHVSCVLRSLGLPFRTSLSFIDDVRPNTWDLDMSLEMQTGKPDDRQADLFIRHFGIDPEDSILFDDGPGNLEPFARRGAVPVWTSTTSIAPGQSDLELAADIGALYVQDMGNFMFNMVRQEAARLNKPLQLYAVPDPERFYI